MCSKENKIQVDKPIQDTDDVTEIDEPPDAYSDVESIPETVQSGFETWYSKMYEQQITTPRLTTLDTKILKIEESYRALRLQPYVDKSGIVFPLNHIREIIPSANRHLRTCAGGKAFKTFFTSRFIDGEQILPDGLQIFDFDVEKELALNAMTEITKLYNTQVRNRDPRILMINPNTRPTNTILFYMPGGEQPTFLDVIKILHTHTPNLAEYIMTYCRAIMGLFSIDQAQLETSQISLVRYDPKAGLNPHIDSIHQFRDTIGPIATIAIGTDEKMFDMLPTLLTAENKPIRIYSQPNQITIMDGMSRVAWSHALPWGYNQEQYTVAIKFPALGTPKRHKNFVYQGVTTQVPYYL